MKIGDRVRVIDEDNEFFGFPGVVASFRPRETFARDRDTTVVVLFRLRRRWWQSRRRVRMVSRSIPASGLRVE